MSLNPSYSSFLSSTINNSSPGTTSTFSIARVTHVVQGPFYVGTKTPDPYYKNPTSLGEITFQYISGPQDRTLTSAGNATAKPLFFGFKQYPLEGELVNIVVGPSEAMNEDRGSRNFYYLPPFNMWNSSHHNAFPDLGDYGFFVDFINRDYQNSSNTNQPINLSATGSLTYPLGPNFIEKSDIKALRQFTGDVTLEGRWGNSIRLGSTTLSIEKENDWSQDSEFGNPITIIRNGQGKPVDNIPWIPTVENINRDPSSIYLTQGQKIIIDDIQKNFSLASLNTQFKTEQTVAIPIQQQLTSTQTISAQEQDMFTQEVTNPPTST